VKLSLHSQEHLSGSQTLTSEGPLISDTLLRLIIGGLWLLDGFLQLQPGMFTMDMINGIMAPVIDGQPAPIAASMHWIVAFTSANLTVINLCIAIVQIVLGVLLLTGRFVKPAIIASIIWALIVWYAGEGMSLLLTGQASILTGAPGAVILYPIIALAFYPRKTADGEQKPLLSRLWLRRIFAFFWIFAALLQAQPYWWQDGQISQAVGSMLSPGTLSALIVDPSLQWFAKATVHSEIALNIVLIAVFLALGIGIFFSKEEHLRPWLIASIVVLLLIWWFAEALGMILTGMGTDPNTGPLLIIMALASWPVLSKVTAPTKGKQE
jgi:hypothetical protein